MRSLAVLTVTAAAFLLPSPAAAQFSEAQLAKWLKRYPKADANRDGRLTVAEAMAFRKTLVGAAGRGKGAPRVFEVDPRWREDRFPEDAVCYRTPEEIAAVYAEAAGTRRPVVRYEKPADGSLRIIGTGHSFMAPGYKALPKVAEAAGLGQPPPLTHIGGGMTGSTRYKWEQENGIFGFEGRPMPKLLASLANAEWDVMTWGPYFNDRPEYYACWIEFGLKHNPDMRFYVSDAWPQLYQLKEPPVSEADLTADVLRRMGEEKFETYSGIVAELNARYGNRVFVMPTCEAMVLAAEAFHDGTLPGVEGIHQAVGGKARSLWQDRLGHLGPGFGNLEGYVFYATLYGRSPELIEGDAFEPSEYPSRELDRRFREIAWQAVLDNPLSGVTDTDGDGVADRRR